MTGAERYSIQVRAQSVANDLIGSCRITASVFAYEAELDDPDFCREFDDRVFCCERCGWWESTDNMCADMVCDDCTSDDDD